jgi:Tfp pilus assembly protein PilX
MKVSARRNKKASQQGIALVLAIFTLMLISVIATSLIVTAGTASAIKANYKSSMEAFYDAKAGLEEGRSRLWPGNPASITNCIFASGSPMPTNQVCYITNPDPTTGETVDPTDPSNAYFDAEWATEFPGQTRNTSPLVTSNSPVSSSIAGPLYKWVRITPRTQVSAGVNIDGSPNPTDGADMLFYGVCPGCDPSNGLNQFQFSGVGTPQNSSQVLTVTALAVTPTGGFSGKRLLQYTVAQNPNPLGQALTPSGSSVPPSLNQIVQAALTLDGNGVTYTGGSAINGQDSNGATGSGVQAIAYTNSSDPVPNCGRGCQSATNPVAPVVGVVTLPSEMQTPTGLDALVNQITQNASVVLTGPADQSNLPSSMSAMNPMIVVVNGDFHLTHGSGNSAFTGYGLLLVTGTFYYDPDDTWNGTILVIGKGVFDGSKNGHGGIINGSVLVANTLDGSGHLLTGPLGPASYNGSGGGNGIHYGSNWVNGIQSMTPYQILSFREIQQQ